MAFGPRPCRRGRSADRAGAVTPDFLPVGRDSVEPQTNANKSARLSLALPKVSFSREVAYRSAPE